MKSVEADDANLENREDVVLDLIHAINLVGAFDPVNSL